MDTLNLDMNKRYTYADYLTWMDDVRRELYDGLIVELSTPWRKHAQVSSHLTGILGNYLAGKKPHIYHAPFDVRMFKDANKTSDDQIYTVVQPDLSIITDLSKLDDRGCLGAPEFIIEIATKETSKRDIKDKFNIYQEHGVLEYWIVSPNDENVTVFILDKNGKFQFVGMYAENDKIPVNIFNGDLLVDLTEVFVA